VNLHPYQQTAVDFVLEKPKCGLFMSMGLGKTLTTLTAIQQLRDQFEIHRVLVIAPLRVAHHTWPDEIGKWDHLDLTYRVIKGPPARRHSLIKYDKSTIHIINRELVTWLVDHFGKKFPYDMVVIDESSSFKNPASKRFKALRKVVPKLNRVVELTGTPVSNGLHDIWSQCWLLDQGERLGRTLTNFRNLYFDADYMGWSYAPKAGADQKIHNKIADLYLSMSTEDYLQMPDRIDNVIEVYLPHSAKARYTELADDFILTMEAEDDIPVLSAAAKVNKMLQLANGAVYVDDTGRWDKVHDEKLDALESIVAEANGAPVLVAYSFVSDRERIKQCFKNAVDVTEPRAIEAWNAGEIQLMLGHPASCGHGLNLQAGGHTLVWFGLPWSLELYAQMNARLHRQGQGHPVMVHHIVAKDTADEQVLQALGEKNVTQKALLQAVRAAI